jgi:hypothetical protein
MAKNLTESQAKKAFLTIVTGLEAQRGYEPGELVGPSLDDRGDAVVRQQGGASWPSAPVLVRDYEGWSTTTRWAIVWEEGPYEWVHYLDGGIEEEFGFDLKPVKTPAGVFVEPIQSFSVGLYQAT